MRSEIERMQSEIEEFFNCTIFRTVATETDGIQVWIP